MLSLTYNPGNLKNIFPLTLESLNIEIKKSNNKALLEKYTYLESRIKKNNLLSEIDLVQSATEYVLENGKFRKEKFDFNLSTIEDKPKESPIDYKAFNTTFNPAYNTNRKVINQKNDKVMLPPKPPQEKGYLFLM